MKELENDEMKAINGGGFWWIAEILVAALAIELITEGFKKCLDDFADGFESTQKH